MLQRDEALQRETVARLARRGHLVEGAPRRVVLVALEVHLDERQAGEDRARFVTVEAELVGRLHALGHEPLGAGQLPGGGGHEGGDAGMADLVGDRVAHRSGEGRFEERTGAVELARLDVGTRRRCIGERQQTAVRRRPTDRLERRIQVADRLAGWPRC